MRVMTVLVMVVAMALLGMHLIVTISKRSTVAPRQDSEYPKNVRGGGMAKSDSIISLRRLKDTQTHTYTCM